MDCSTLAGEARTSGIPELRLDLRALERNIEIMAAWCRDQGVELSPHIKTTMTRPIVERQMEAGAWGVTVATVQQAGVALAWGLRRVVIANQVLHDADLALMRRWLERFEGLELYCFVDSEVGVERARRAMEGTTNALRVLIDVGMDSGRTGVREPHAAHALGSALRASSGLHLAGVAGYEGVGPNTRDEEALGEIDDYCRRVTAVFCHLMPLFQTERPVVSLGGSAFPDRAVHVLAQLREQLGNRSVLPLLRSGCYVAHDHGTYQEVSPIPGLRPALSVRAMVLSTPEPGLAVIGAGKRELPHDAGLPVLIGARDPQGRTRPTVAATATRIYDHHLVLAEAYGLQPGDEADLGISHPCSAFDRWPDITVTGDDGRPCDIWHPQFR
ncbi:alanine racemase [Streptomyces sp. NPDC090442]|uniref:alanine racemase n=1 Tax=Streptomyces sp. NPDC090442 TaxID=3365962 RepID=UPI00381708F1